MASKIGERYQRAVAFFQEMMKTPYEKAVERGASDDELRMQAGSYTEFRDLAIKTLKIENIEFIDDSVTEKKMRLLIKTEETRIRETWTSAMENSGRLNLLDNIRQEMDGNWVPGNFKF